MGSWGSDNSCENLNRIRVVAIAILLIESEHTSQPTLGLKSVQSLDRSHWSDVTRPQSPGHSPSAPPLSHPR